mmetsp:Transcript_21782/g.54009  ORF Transcript_21782/g.54009 Transcript_21782/m.54009 type:complete len:209 (+) Transcript_21782:1204-1830(+)
MPRRHRCQGSCPVFDSIVAFFRVQISALHWKRQFVGNHIECTRHVVHSQQSPNNGRRFHRSHRRPVFQLANLDRPSGNLVVFPMQGRHGQACEQRSAVSIGKPNIALVNQKIGNHPQIVMVVELLGPLDGLGDVVGRRLGSELGDSCRVQLVIALLFLLAVVFLGILLFLAFHFFALRSWKSFLLFGWWRRCCHRFCGIFFFLLDLRH